MRGTSAGVETPTKVKYEISSQEYDDTWYCVLHLEQVSGEGCDQSRAQEGAHQALHL